MSEAPAFTASMPEHYDRLLGPAMFGPFAEELVRRFPANPGGDVLELACGTGLLTGALRRHLAPSATLVASDVSAPMLRYAAAKLAGLDGIEWREADAMDLPFPDGRFAAVACAFGAMFMPDKGKFFAEVARVSKPGAAFVFSVWDRLENNRHGQTGAATIQSLFPGDPDVNFGTPYSMHDTEAIRRWLEGAGFGSIVIENVRRAFGPIAARDYACGVVHGTPRGVLLARKGASLDEVVERVAQAVAEAGGDPYLGEASAFIVTARAPG